MKIVVIGGTGLIGSLLVTATVPFTLTPGHDQMFRPLISAQIARAAAYGARRTVRRGEVLIEAGG